MKPFLKWAGGKRWLTSRFRDLSGSLGFGRYIEPFLGGGAFFFHLRPTDAILADRNKSLIETYSALRTDWAKVWDLLVSHQRNHSDDYYYKVRDQFSFDTSIARAAQFIYLNRTCWNGLYRENLDGRFNVPKGTKSTVIFPDDDFAAVSDALQPVHLICSDFEAIIQQTDARDLVFVDPPYTVNHNRNGFLKYNEKIFSWEDQIRLRDAVRAKASEGVKFIIMNAYHPSVMRLYEGLGRVTPLARHSVLSGVGRFRIKTQEVLITVGLDPGEILREDRARISLNRT